MIGAAIPIVAKSGSMPMSAVAVPISTTLMIRVGRRPMRSPRLPNSTAPSGRATKPTPNVANAASAAACGSSSVKKRRLNTSAAANPNR